MTSSQTQEAEHDVALIRTRPESAHVVCVHFVLGGPAEPVRTSRSSPLCWCFGLLRFCLCLCSLKLDEASAECRRFCGLSARRPASPVFTSLQLSDPRPVVTAWFPATNRRLADRFRTSAHQHVPVHQNSQSSVSGRRSGSDALNAESF